MRRLTYVCALVLMVAACGGTAGDESTTTLGETTTTAADATTTTAGSPSTSEAGDTTTTAPVSSGGPQFVLTSIVFGASPMVVISNIGDEAGSLSGHFLCQRPSYEGLPDVEVPAGGAIAFSLGGDTFSPPPGAIAAEEPLSLGGLSNGGGEVGLYTSSNFSSSTDIISYVEWGSPDHGRSATAVEAGIWSGFVPTTDSTLSLAAQNLPAVSADDWGEG